MLRIFIILVCIVGLYAQDATTNQTSSGYSEIETQLNNVVYSNENNTGGADSSSSSATTGEKIAVTSVGKKINVTKVVAAVNKVVSAKPNVRRRRDVNSTHVDIDGVLNATVLNGTVQNVEEVNEGYNGKIEVSTTTDAVTYTSNESFLERAKAAVKRVFKREASKEMTQWDPNEHKGDGIVGSLVIRDTYEMEDNKHYTVPMIFQAEYYKLRLRKQEIERNKKIWRDKENKTQYYDLMQETWEKLVNWSQDHIKFEKKVIQMAKLKINDHIRRTKEIDSDDDDPDSEDKLIDIDPDEDSDRSLPPEFATEKNLNEVRDRYVLEKDIDEIKTKMRLNPKEEDNEKNRLLLEQYETDLKLVETKYNRIRAMKLNREMVENVWQMKSMIKKKGEKKDSDEEE